MATRRRTRRSPAEEMDSTPPSTPPSRPSHLPSSTLPPSRVRSTRSRSRARSTRDGTSILPPIRSPDLDALRDTSSSSAASSSSGTEASDDPDHSTDPAWCPAEETDGWILESPQFRDRKPELLRAFQADQLLRARLQSLQGKRFALIRDFSVADFFTLANAVCGALSIFLCLNYLENSRYEPYLGWAFVLLPLSLIFDILDGKIARMTHSMSPYGADLDSLADLISFGVAPAVMGFALGLRGVYDSLILVFSICCGLSRLARYNVTANILSGGAAKVKYYEGLPIPGNLINVVILYILWLSGKVHNETFWLGRWEIWPGHFHPFSLFYLVTGYAMISQIRIPKP